MKKILHLLIFVGCLVGYAQPKGPLGGEFKLNPSNLECLTQEKRSEIVSRLAAAKQELRSKHKIAPSATPAGAHPLFQWPVVKNPTAFYHNVWSMSAYVDHNPGYPNQVADWNCGDRTYDVFGYNHQGTDIFTWPFSWYQMANDQSWVIAAADGIILEKHNGNADMNCAPSGGDWNAVYVLHADGSVAWYGHLKNNSLTAKAIGETVEAGEYLGVIGSSGNSNAPHLHFEVYDSSDNLIDPYAGACNTWETNDSWWSQQRPYIDPKINAVLTHSAPPVFPNCPQIESPNLKNEFQTNEVVYCAGYFADQNTGVPVIMRLFRPDGTLAYTDSVTTPALYYASYWYWSFSSLTLNQIGIWTLAFTFGGETVSHEFAWGTTLHTADVTTSDMNFYPNPARDRIVFSSDVKSLEACTADGKRIEIRVNAREADISHLPNGVFILSGTDGSDRAFMRKLLK